MCLSADPSKRNFFFAIVALAGLLWMPMAARAQCAGICQPNEIAIGHDKDTCHCLDLDEYRTCTTEARDHFNKKLGSCESVLACLRRNDIHEEGGLCAAASLSIPLAVIASGSAAVPLAIAGTAVTCSWLGRDGLNKAKDCINTTGAACKAQALEQIKADVADCQSE